MKKSNLYYWTGIAGIAMYALGMIEIPLYFIYSGPPPVENILTRVLINMFACVGLIGFISGFRSIIVQTNPVYKGLGSFIFSIGFAYAILTYVADSIQVGSVWVSKIPIDPTLVGAGGEGALLIYGPIDRLLTTVLLVACGLAIIMTRIIPIWTGWLACLVSVCHIAPVPTIFYMSEPSDFFSANGWNIPIAGGLFLIWVMIVSIFLVRKKSKEKLTSTTSTNRGYGAAFLDPAN